MGKQTTLLLEFHELLIHYEKHSIFSNKKMQNNREHAMGTQMRRITLNQLHIEILFCIVLLGRNQI